MQFIFYTLLLVLVIFGIIEYRGFLKRTMVTNSQVLAVLIEKSKEMGRILLIKLIASIGVSFIISFIFFRHFWSNDTFQAVFLASIMLDKANKYANQYFE